MTRALARPSPTQDHQSERAHPSDRATPNYDPILSQQTPLAAIAPRACALAAFLLPLKLSLAYIVTVPLLTAFAWTERQRISRFVAKPSVAHVTAPLTILLAIACLSAVTGLSLLHSLPSLISLLFFSLTIPLFALHAEAKVVLTALIAGQSIAALHSLFEAALPGGLPRMFLGHVTESGQLALTIPVAIGVAALSAQSIPLAQRPRQRIASLLLAGFVITTSLVLLGFHSEATLSSLSIACLTTIAITGLALGARLGTKALKLPQSLLFLSLVQIPLLICALVVNLKRGPWIGTLIAALVFCTLYARRLVVCIVACAIALTCSITPVRERLLASYDHFTIAGGRSTIWRIGAELATEYPLGIGYHNSGIMRELAPEIPPQLKHFHNNLINITTELGWFGGAVFIWFLLALLKACFRQRSAFLYTAIGCAMIAWQTAGLFEYNFGDSEITIIVWALIGLVLQREYRAGYSVLQKS